MNMLKSLSLFRPMFKCASFVSTPIKEVGMAGIQAGKVGGAVGDVAEFTTKTTPKEVSNICKKLFSSFEEFKENALSRLSMYRTDVPEKMYTDVEKSVINNKFELTKVISGYYSKLNECKTLEDAIKLYPEFAHLNLDMTKELKMLIKSSIPESVCKEALKLPTKEARLRYVTEYMEQSTNNCVKEWQSYPDILKIHQETANEIANGLYKGNSEATAGLKFFANKEPLRFYLLDKKDRDRVLLSYLKQYYFEGKSIQNITPEIVKGRVISPNILNNKGFYWANPSFRNFRTIASTIDKDCGEYMAISQLTSKQINSAVMKRTWSKSGLKMDIANQTRFGNGWTNVGNILKKRNGMENDISSSDEMINRYLLNRFKSNNRTVTEKNPFIKIENPENDIVGSVKRFVNSMYHVNEITINDKIILKSKEFQNFKSQFDIDGMKKSIYNIEDHYIKIFFKRFWTDIRKEKFVSALSETSGTACQNIEISDSLLMRAMNDAFI